MGSEARPLNRIAALSDVTAARAIQTFWGLEGARSEDAAAQVEMFFFLCSKVRSRGTQQLVSNLFCVFGDVLLERDSMTDLFEIDRASHLKDFDCYRSR